MATPFHAGGSINPKTGRLSSRPAKGKRFSKLAMLEKLCRLDLGGISSGIVIPDNDLAKIIGKSGRYIRTLRTTPEYQRFRIQIQTGISLDTEKSAAEISDYRIQHFRMNLPTAIKAVLDELERPAHTIQERKLKLDLAKDFLDREGTFPRISRSDNHLKVEHDYAQADNAARGILDAIGTVQHDEIPERTQKILDANSSFSNSETLTHDKQEEALATLEAMPPATEAIN